MAWNNNQVSFTNGFIYKSSSQTTGLATTNKLYDYTGPATLDASTITSVFTTNGKVYPASLALNFIIKA